MMHSQIDENSYISLNCFLIEARNYTNTSIYCWSSSKGILFLSRLYKIMWFYYYSKDSFHFDYYFLLFLFHNSKLGKSQNLVALIDYFCRYLTDNYNDQQTIGAVLVQWRFLVYRSFWKIYDLFSIYKLFYTTDAAS